MKISLTVSNPRTITSDQVSPSLHRRTFVYDTVCALALYPLTVADYPKQVLPDLHLIKLFRDIELLKENCEQRNLMVDVNQLASDYQLWQARKKEYRRLRDLHHVQEKLRAQQQSTDDLSMTDTNETETNKVKKRKKKVKPIATAATTAEETTPPADIK